VDYVDPINNLSKSVQITDSSKGHVLYILESMKLMQAYDVPF